MTTIKDPKAMTTQDPRWLTWYVQQRRFERIKHGGYTAPSLVLRFENETYQMGAQNTPPDYRSYSDLITFTRASGGGITNAAGEFEWVGTNVPRITYDPVTLKRLGQLIEEQRTNLLLWSASFDNASWARTGIASVAADATISPNGTQNADTVTRSGAGGFENVNGTTTSTAATSYFCSAYVKAGSLSTASMTLISGTTDVRVSFDLVANSFNVIQQSGTHGGQSITDVGNGWRRIGFWITAQSTSIAVYLYPGRVGTTEAGSVSLWGAQLEVGSSASSYIPTTTTQVTRAADVAAVNTLSPWYNPLEGTIVVKASASVTAAISRYITLPSFARLRVNSSAFAFQGIAGASVDINVVTNLPVPDSATHKIAAAYRKNDCKISVDGGQLITDSSATITAATSLVIGNNGSSGEFLNGIITSITYYPRVIDVQQASA